MRDDMGLHPAACRISDLDLGVQMTFLLNARPVDALALIVHESRVVETGRFWVEKLCTSRSARPSCLNCADWVAAFTPVLVLQRFAGRRVAFAVRGGSQDHP